MRLIGNVISLLLIVAVVVGLVAFSIGNGTQFSLSFFGYTFYHVPVRLPTVVGAVVGFPPGILRAHPWAAAQRLAKQPPAQQDSQHEAASEKELSGLR